MIVAGIVLLVLGMLFGIPLLTTLGVIVILVGLVFLVMGSTGRPFAGRRYWY